MFGRAELRHIRKAAERDPAATRVGDWHVARAACNIAAGAGLRTRLAAATDVAYYPPEQIFGKVFDPACLDGVTVAATQLGVPEISAYELDRGRIVGFNAAMDGDGRLCCQGFASSEEECARLLRRNALDQDGFLLLREPGGFVVRYGAGAVQRHFSGTALLLTNIEPGNYGRFVIGVLPQLLYLKEFAPSFDYYVTGDRAAWLGAAMAELGLPEKPVFAVKEVCGDSFDKVILLDDVHGNGILPAFVTEAYRKLAARFAGRSKRRPASRIYVSRSLSRAARARYRLMVNEVDDIEPAAASRGFTVVYPEIFNWQEQIALFHHAAMIAGPSGSGMLNATFAEAGTRLIDFESVHSTVRQHARTYASTQKRYAFGFGDLDPQDPHPNAFSRWTLPLPVFHQGLDWLMS